MGLISRVSSRTYRLMMFIRRALSTSFKRANFSFSFASPSGALYADATNVKQIDLPTGTGMMGILPSHVPSLGVLAPGWATVYEENDTKKFFVSSGSYTINNDGSVTIAAEEAVPESDICLDKARAALTAAQSAAASGSEESKLEAQVAVETLEAMLR